MGESGCDCSLMAFGPHQIRGQTLSQGQEPINYALIQGAWSSNLEPSYE
jgi:hypothetical protein